MAYLYVGQSWVWFLFSHQLFGDWEAQLRRIMKLIAGGGLSITGSHDMCGDYLYSGHTVMLTLTYLFIKECKSRVALRENFLTCRSPQEQDGVPGGQPLLSLARSHPAGTPGNVCHKYLYFLGEVPRFLSCQLWYQSVLWLLEGARREETKFQAWLDDGRCCVHSAAIFQALGTVPSAPKKCMGVGGASSLRQALVSGRLNDADIKWEISIKKCT